MDLSWGGVLVFRHPLTPPAYCRGLGDRSPQWGPEAKPRLGVWTRDKVPRCLSFHIELILNNIVQTNLSFKLFFLFIKLKLENIAIVNALQLEAARATPALSCSALITSYDVMPVAELINCRIIAFLLLMWYITLRCDLDLWPLTLNICSVTPVTWWNFLPNLNAIVQSAA